MFGLSKASSNASSNPSSKASSNPSSNHSSNHLFVSNEISTYIKDTTNKSLEKYKNKVRFVTTDLTNDSYPNKAYLPNFFALLPFVSLMSFLAGYKFCKQMN